MALRLNDIIKYLGNIFEKKKKNAVLLPNDTALSSDLKRIKVGEEDTPVEISKTEVRVRGTINADAINVDGSAVQTGTDAGATELNELSDVTYSAGDLTISSLDTIVAGGNLVLDVAGDIELNADGGDITFKDGILSLASMGQGDFKSYYNATNYLRIVTSSAGAVQLRTIGSTAADADFTLDAGGDIVLDSGTGLFIAKNAGTEFSAANSSYAGMILGYTDIGLDETTATYDLTTSYAVPTSEFKVAFVIPPSGNVEIEIQVMFDVGASNVGDLYAGLSDNATYNAVDDFHEVELFDAMSRGAIRVIRHSWTLTGLTGGAAEEIWVGFKSSSTSGTPHLQWGGDATAEFPDFIMKATALPATIAT